MRAGFRILVWTVPVVAVAVGVIDLIVLGPICISVDCTNAQPNWERSTAIFEWAALVVVAWLIAMLLHRIARWLRR
jgi:predicted DCC family thiol-disulfide oxidoreductase YuxK